MAKTTKRRAEVKRLSHGSDVEIAELLAAELIAANGEVHYCEGQFWRYAGMSWEAIPEHELRRQIHPYDGARYGDRGVVRLGKARINSIIHELGAILAAPNFFADRLLGINCLSGFIAFDAAGQPQLLPHAREHRQRHVLRGHWQPPTGPVELPKGSLLHRLLTGCFEGDPDASEKIELLAEIAGVAALGYATRVIEPKAFVMLGRTAGNGKSQVLDMLRGLLPPTAVVSVPPSKMSDERYVPTLAGKYLNTSDELGSAAAIASDSFKSVVTGEPITGRVVYKEAINFRPEAQHVFACNQLPSFQGGMDKGVLRRLAVIPFNRTIPKRERIERIGTRIAEEEMDLLLAFAVEGASRLLRQQDFSELESGQEALTEWAQSADPVLAWLEQRVEIDPSAPGVPSRVAFNDFRDWGMLEGYAPGALPATNSFVQRVRAAGALLGISYKRSGKFRGFVGMRLRAKAELHKMAA